MTPVPTPIEKCMSTVLFVAAPKETIADAARRMKLHSIRHMPVVDGGRVVGILSDRDVAVVEALKSLDTSRILVEDAMTSDPYVVDPLDSLARVANTMAERKIGSAVVARNGQLMGLFTTTDALRVLCVVLAAANATLPPEVEAEL
ncbi:MAG: CBS domain-containing protein [Planctomycetes bacterium]|nr:CBS domain-containing protein [Planctomycetota bacterium]